MRKTEPGNIYEYVSEWITFQKRYNLVLPTIPIYSNIYYDFYNEYLQDYNIMGCRWLPISRSTTQSTWMLSSL